MNKRQRTVMSMLKPKVKAFGFNRKEVEGIAARIADNLKSEEDASDEDVNAEIEKDIEAVLPLLEIGRSYANRVINDSKKNDDEENDNDEEADEEPAPKSKKSPKNRKSKSEEEPEWFKTYRETMERKLSDIAGERISDKRKARLEKLLKDTGRFGERTLKSYARMSFKDDEEFDEFISEIEEDLKSENQDRANKGLEKLGAPATGGSMKKDTKPEVLSDADVKALASI